MKKLLLSLLLLTSGCGFNGNQKITTSDSEQRIIQDGESYTYVVIRLEFIEQIRLLCEDAYLQSDFETEHHYDQAVAQCTLNNLDLFDINLGQVTDFSSEYCKDDADLSEFTLEEIAEIEQVCSLLGQ